ncbi:branched-chain amino acid ABC transporter substrate-binding protein [Halodesulfovibrio spirochaetisodalis]|uniref:Amino acid ABC transporter substrate-binding protein n=1 Tax=Halodesulfovibrio spirochaetisodalis TaxID=1560234 RepID=A0A1B7XES6_9BACT|nr:branched-chain amino acid ABC transporter substrate-binding protein [Halodesulfovibrio spirochaetisodalis]OBQ52677.1 amino acid ABC transporter substrate-binding protein [Halodesulfovibrio spirochaetisodalis]
MKRFMRVLALGLVASLLLSSAALAADTIKIGLQAPLTGKYASEGLDMKNLVEILAAKVNADGGVKGKKIEIIAEDDAFDPKTAALAAQRLVTSGVVAVIGTYGSSITEAAQDIYDEEDVIQIATGSTMVRLTEKGLENFFRTCPRDDSQGAAAAQVLKDRGYKRIAILHDNSSYAKGLADETRKRLDDNSVVFFDALNPGEQDYNTILTKIKGFNPDVIFFTGYFNEAGLLLRQKKEMKWDVAMMGGDATNNLDLVKIAGNDAAKGFFFVSPPGVNDLTSPFAKEVLDTYKAKYNSLPASIWSVFAGDAFLAIVEALRQTDSTDPEVLSEYLRNKMDNYPGLTGSIAFDNKGDRAGKFYRVSEVNADGEFVMLP